MHQYKAQVQWNRDGARFVDNRYSRAHQWEFDGGAKIPASASPSIVPLPLSVAENVDPEEALVAAASSCHMLWFLSIAAKRGFLIDQYIDDASGVMEKSQDGKWMMTRIILSPRISFSGERTPSTDELEKLHHDAHEECQIANSLKSEIIVRAPGGDAL
jgi:organic hydroperoxide reductase OsmC/OhrA